MKNKILVIIFLLLFAFASVFSVDTFYKYNYPLKYREEIVENARVFGKDPAFIASIIRVESRFNPNAVSRRGAVGLMQILPSTAEFIAKNLGVKNFSIEMLFEPSLNIKFGCYYLQFLGKKFEGERAVLSAYNAGEGVVRAWLKNEEYSDDGATLKHVPYKETKTYVEKISKCLPVYQKMFDK